MARTHMDIEAERQTLIGMLKEVDLSESMARKVRLALTKPEKKERSPMPTVMTVEEVVERLRKQRSEPSVGIPHEEVIKIASQW